MWDIIHVHVFKYQLDTFIPISTCYPLMVKVMADGLYDDIPEVDSIGNSAEASIIVNLPQTAVKCNITGCYTRSDMRYPYLFTPKSCDVTGECQSMKPFILFDYTSIYYIFISKCRSIAMGMGERHIEQGMKPSAMFTLSPHPSTLFDVVPKRIFVMTHIALVPTLQVPVQPSPHSQIKQRCGQAVTSTLHALSQAIHSRL